MVTCEIHYECITSPFMVIPIIFGFHAATLWECC